MIRVDHISYRAGNRRRKILDDISCNILPGGVTVLLGANGAGKSTFLRILSGEQSPQSGKVWWNDRPLHAMAPAELAKRRAVLTQHATIDLPFTVEEIVLMGRYPHYGSKPSVRDKDIVMECLKEMQVAHLSGRAFPTLSGGEQQRVQMARVLAQLEGAGDKILLLDEPTSNLDLLHQQLCLQKARQLSRKGHIVIVVLHDLNLAAQFADAILLLKQGRLLATGPTKAVLIPELIRQAYDMDIAVLYPEGYLFPIIVPATNKKQLYVNN
ncbi:MAG TPA: heme ABC transporter ATP-binding protein [Puia sp.]|nr:heme ABC transporter ATP-binding protein [Puia sp.]